MVLPDVQSSHSLVTANPSRRQDGSLRLELMTPCLLQVGTDIAGLMARVVD